VFLWREALLTERGVESVCECRDVESVCECSHGESLSLTERVCGSSYGEEKESP